MKNVMFQFKYRTLISVLMLSLFVLTNSINIGLFTKFRNYESEDLGASNDELGGSLLDAVVPSSDSATNLFDTPNPQPVNSISEVNLTKAIEQVNKPPTNSTNNKTNSNITDDKNITDTGTGKKLELQKDNKISINGTNLTLVNNTISNSSQTKEIDKLIKIKNDISTKNETSKIDSKNQTEGQNTSNITNNNKNVTIDNSNFSKNYTSNSIIKNSSSNINNTNINESKNATNLNKTDDKIQQNSTNSTIVANSSNGNSNVNSTTESKTPELSRLFKRVTKSDNISPPKEINNLVSNYANDSKSNSSNTSTLISAKSSESSILKRTVTSQTNEKVNTSEIITANLHAHYAVPETENMRYTALIFVIIFGSMLLIIKLIGYLIARSSKNFFFKGVKNLSKEMVYYFTFLTFVYVMYTFGMFDSLKINWEYCLASLGLFGLCWIVFNLIILVFTTLAAKKWTELELDCKNSFKHINENRSKNSELVQYMLIKTQFCVPFYPIFKPSVLPKDFRFDIYLSMTLQKQIKWFFKFSWSSWLVVVLSFLIWSVLIAERSVLFITIFIMLFPIIGLVVVFLLYWYMKRFYSNNILPANYKLNIEYLDYENDQIILYLRTDISPAYLDRYKNDLKNNVEPNSKFHEHFHNYVPNLYEDQILFGGSGFSLILNSLQTAALTFVIWTLILFVKHYTAILSSYGNLTYAFIIPALLIYTVAYSFLISITLRWYSLISSVHIF